MIANRRLRSVPETSGRVVAYIRVSSLMGRGGDDFHSPAMQLEHIRRSAGHAGLHEVGVVEDLDRSGQTFSRQGIDKIRAMVEQKHVDVVAVYDLSRLGRDLAESLNFVRWLRERNVSVMSTQERIDDSPEGQYMLGMFLGLAELYGAQVGRRWAQILERRARAGRHHGVIPQGYATVDKVMVEDPVLGPAVREVFAAYARGDFVSDIMDRFAAARGKPVSRNVIKNMLKNPTYRGRTVVNSQIAGRIDVEGDHPALVDDATWTKVNARLEKDGRAPARHTEPSHSLTSLIWCPSCRHAAQVWYSPENGRVKRLVCGRSNQSSDKCGGFGAPRYCEVEQVVLTKVAEYAALLRSNPADRAAQISRTQRAGIDAATLKSELASTRSAMSRITERWGRGSMPDVAYEGSMAELEATERLLLIRLEEVEAIAGAPEPGKVVVLIEEVLRMWGELTEPERNRALRAVVRQVFVRKAARWREPVADRVDDADIVWVC